MHNLLKETELGERIDVIDALYRDLQEAEERFCNYFDIHCTKGCGCCCEHFTPDITPAEAEYLAYGIVKEGKAEQTQKIIDNYDNTNKMCPLYNPDDEYHCTVYQYRPLICRLFGASASNDKHGNPVFKKCKWNKQGKDVPSSVFEQHKDEVITMREYGIRLEESNYGITKTEMLPYALERAISKIQFISALKENQDREQ